jgi:hypothetical protein
LKKFLRRMLPVLGMLAVGYALVYANSTSSNVAESRYWIDEVARSGMAS